MADFQRRRGKNKTAKKGDVNYTLSRKLSNLLRHRVHHNGLSDCLRPDGYVSLARVLALPQFSSVTEETIKEVVETNDKQRFNLTSEDVNNTPTLFIRANQGHTIHGIDEEKLLTRIEVTDGESSTAIHGTYLKAWNSILESGGLSKMNRQHIHLAAALPGERGVISGMRFSSS